MRRSIETSRWRIRLLVAVLALLAGTGGIAVAQLGPQPTGLINTPCGDYPEGDSCASGLCVDVTVGQVCSNYCATDDDCTLNGWGCRAITQGNGEKVSFCAPRRHLANP